MDPPKVNYVLIPRTCGYVTIHGKKDFANVISLQILKRGAYPALSGWANIITTVVMEGRQERQSEKKEI